MPEWNEEEDEEPIEAPSEVAQEATVIGEFESDAEEVKDGKWPAVFQGAKPWSSQEFTPSPGKTYEKMIFSWLITDGPNKNQKVQEFFGINPMPGKNPTPQGIINNRLAALGWPKTTKENGKIVYKGDFIKSIGTSVYIETKTDDFGVKVKSASKGDARSDELAEAIVQ